MIESGPSQVGGWGDFSPPVFGQTVNPISTRGADYSHHSNPSPPGFSDLATALTDLYNVSSGQLEKKCIVRLEWV